MKRILVATVLLGLAALQTGSSAEARKQNWTHFVRIGAWGLHSDNAERIIREAEESHVFGVEVDNDITGRYESFLDPSEKLKAIRTVSDAAHKAGNRAFVYIAGTECIAAHADKYDTGFLLGAKPLGLSFNGISRRPKAGEVVFALVVSAVRSGNVCTSVIVTRASRITAPLESATVPRTWAR